MAMAAPRLSLQGLFFVYLSLSSHWHHPLVLNLRIFFEVHLSFFALFVSCFIIAGFSALFFNWHELWLWWHEFFLFILNNQTLLPKNQYLLQLRRNDLCQRILNINSVCFGNLSNHYTKISSQFTY